MSHRVFGFTIVAAALTLHSQASVLVVSPSGPFTQIQAAVTAANDGDVLLVKTGAYSTFTVVNKSLVIVADTGALPVVNGHIRIRDVDATREVLVSGLTAQGAVTLTHRLLIDNDAGTIRFQDCVIRGGFSGSCHGSQSGALVTDCPDVAFSNCEFVAGEPVASEALGSQPGLVVIDSRVVLSGCTLRGGAGGNDLCDEGLGEGGPGGSALTIASSEVWMSGSACTGGDGGDSIGFSGGSGGAGVTVLAPSTLHLLDCTLLGGAGGSPFGTNGAPILIGIGANTVVNHPGTARLFDVTPVVRPAGSRTLTFDGVAGDNVAMYSHSFGDWSFDPLVNWVRSIAAVPAARFLRYGMVPGSGTLSFATTAGPLAPGVQAAVSQMQSVHRELGGALFFGSPRFTVIVDPSF